MKLSESRFKICIYNWLTFHVSLVWEIYHNWSTLANTQMTKIKKIKNFCRFGAKLCCGSVWESSPTCALNAKKSHNFFFCLKLWVERHKHFFKECYRTLIYLTFSSSLLQSLVNFKMTRICNQQEIWWHAGLQSWFLGRCSNTSCFVAHNQTKFTERVYDSVGFLVELAKTDQF